MAKKSEIRENFSEFHCNNFFKWAAPFSFKCDDKNNCDCHPDSEPIWTPAFGDEKKTTVMLVGEAPSTSSGIGPHLGGLFEDWRKINGNDDVLKFRDFFKKQLGFTPYFTDLVKCGPKNTSDKKTIKSRAIYCVERFLLEEIRIIDPISIYCIGRTPYDWLRKYKLKNSAGKNIELKLLIHYSRQAGLPLIHEDKELIWKWQLGNLAKDNVENVPLSELSFFNPAKKNKPLPAKQLVEL